MNNNNNQNNQNSNQSTAITDSKTTMIRKRKRNEKPETNSCHLNSLSNLEHQIFNKIKHHEYCNGLKPFSIISEERCVICKEELTIPSSDKYSCSQCYKHYHKKCLPSILKEFENHTEITCALCEKHTVGKCILCSKQINSDSEIQVCCELCGCLMHFDCLNGIPLHILYKRKFYEMFTTNNESISFLAGENIDVITQEFELALKNFEEKYSQITNSTSSIVNMCKGFSKSAEVGDTESPNVDKSKSIPASFNKKEMLKHFLKEFFFNKFPIEQSESDRRTCDEYVEKLCNLFYICKICLWNVDKKEKVNFFEFKIAKGTAFKRINFTNLAMIHEIFAIATMIKNDSIDLAETKTDYKVDKIIDFYHLNRNCADEGYYLIKWKKNNVKYSFEYSKFVEAFEEFPKFKQEYEKRKRREIEYYELYFNSQLRKKNENNSKSFAQIDSHNSSEKLWTKSFLQEFQKNSLDYTSDLNPQSNLSFAHSIIEDLESNNIFILNEIKSIDDFRKTFLSPLMNKIMDKDTISKYPNNNFNPSSINYFQMTKPKVLICFDNDTILQKWKDIFSFSLSNNTLTYLVYRFKNRFQRILYEMFYLDLSKTSTALKSIIYKDEDNRQTNPEEFFKLFDTLITDYNHTKFDVILVDKNVFLFEYLNLFSKINFDLILMDFLERDSVIKVKEIIKLNSLEAQQRNNNNNLQTTKLIILKSMDILNNADDFEINFSNFLFNFYTANDYLIVPPANHHSGLKLLSKDKQFFPIKMDEMLDYLKREFKWVVVNPNANINLSHSIRSNPYALSNSDKSNYFYLTREENILELDLTFPRIILNFIGVNLTKTELLQYVSILKERKNLVLNKKQENKTDLIKNLSAFCSFPGLMVKYYLNKLEDKNLKLSDDSIVNRNKIKCLKNLIKNIFTTGKENFDLRNFAINENENSFNKIHVNVIYSEPALDTESRSPSVFKFLKQNVIKDFEKERKFIHFYSLSTDYEDIFSHSQEHNVFIFFNLFLSPKITGRFFRRMFNCFKNRNLFIFQLFVENSIEQNLVEEFYTSATEEILFKENILINLMSKETKENVLKKNLINLKYSESDSAGGSISDDGLIFNPSENTKLEMSNFDGLIVVDNCIQIFTKNSNFIQNQSQSQLEWDYILDEYFSEEKLTNSKDEFNFIQTRNKKTLNVVNNQGMWLSNDISSAITEKSSVKKQKLILDDDEEDLPDYIIRTSVDNHKMMNKSTDLLAMCSSLAASKPNKPSCNQAYNVEINLLEEESLQSHQTNLINKMTDKSLIDRLISENPNLSQSIKKNNDKNAAGVNSNCLAHTSNNSQIAGDHNKFKNLSVLNTSNLSYEKNPNMSINNNFAPKRIDFESYLELIESHSAEYVSNDILHDLNSVLINSGMNLHIRKFIFTYVMKFGIDMDNLDEYINTLQKEIKSFCNSGKEIKIDLLRFYVEYMLIILSKCISFEKDSYYQFYFFLGGFRLLTNNSGSNVESSQTVEIKRRILISMKLKEFLNLPTEKIKEEIKNIFQIITKTLSTSSNPKLKFNLQSYNPEIFINFLIKFLKYILTYGYGEYRQIVDSFNNCMSSELLHGLNCGNVHDGQKLKFYLLWMITSPPLKNDLNVDSILAEFLEELFTILEKNILDKF